MMGPPSDRGVNARALEELFARSDGRRGEVRAGPVPFHRLASVVILSLFFFLCSFPCLFKPTFTG